MTFYQVWGRGCSPWPWKSTKLSGAQGKGPVLRPCYCDPTQLCQAGRTRRFWKYFSRIHSEGFLPDSQCLGKKTKQSSLVWSLNQDKIAKEDGSHGLPGNVTFTRPQHLPRTQRCPLPHQSKVAKNRQCNLSSLAKDLGRAVLHFQHTCASFEKVQRLLRALSSQHPGPFNAGLFSSLTGQQQSNKHNC